MHIVGALILFFETDVVSGQTPVILSGQTRFLFEPGQTHVSFSIGHPSNLQLERGRGVEEVYNKFWEKKKETMTSHEKPQTRSLHFRFHLICFHQMISTDTHTYNEQFFLSFWVSDDGSEMANMSWIIMFYILCSWNQSLFHLVLKSECCSRSGFHHLHCVIFFVLGSQQDTNYATQCTRSLLHYPLNQLKENRFLICSWKLFLERIWTCLNIIFGKKMATMKIYKPWR